MFPFPFVPTSIVSSFFLPSTFSIQPFASIHSPFSFPLLPSPSPSPFSLTLLPPHLPHSLSSSSSPLFTSFSKVSFLIKKKQPTRHLQELKIIDDAEMIGDESPTEKKICRLLQRHEKKLCRRDDDAKTSIGRDDNVNSLIRHDDAKRSIGHAKVGMCEYESKKTTRSSMLLHRR